MASINYNDSRFTEIEKDKNAAINQSNSTYDNLINQSSKYYDNLIAQSKEAADKQTALQNQQTEFAIDKIEQQKEQANKDYTKEQKGAYQDYMKQSNAYGSNMQAAGQQGLGGSGWSETIQAGFYNTYQNRYAQARENYNTIIMNYDNNIKEAQLQNSSALLQIYNQAQKEQLELALQNYTVIKDLSLAKQNAYMDIDNEYNDRWRQVEAQINTENSLAEQIRQFNAEIEEKRKQREADTAYRNAQLDLQRKELAQQQSQWQQEFNLQKTAAQSATLTQGGSGGNSSATKSAVKSGVKNVAKAASKVVSALTSGSSKKSSKSSINMEQDAKNYKAVESLLGTTMKNYSSSNIMTKAMKKSTAQATLNEAYKSGKITQSQFKSLASKYDL